MAYLDFFVQIRQSNQNVRPTKCISLQIEILFWGKQKMKKILNEPVAYVDEMLEGLCAAPPEYFRHSGPQGRLISRATGAVAGKVGIVSGGGSGHLAVFTGLWAEGCWTRAQSARSSPHRR